MIFSLAVVLAVGGVAFALELRRPHAISDQDTDLFTKALRHWATAAYEARKSPREMKRFLNRLRFAAAGRAQDLSDDVLVGLAVLEHAGGEAMLSAVKLNGVVALFEKAKTFAKLAAPIHRQRCFSEILVRGDFGCGSSFGFFAA